MKPSAIADLKDDGKSPFAHLYKDYCSRRWTVSVSFEDSLCYQEFGSYVEAKKMFITIMNLSDVTESVCRVLGFLQEDKNDISRNELWLLCRR